MAEEDTLNEVEHDGDGCDASRVFSNNGSHAPASHVLSSARDGGSGSVRERDGPNPVRSDDRTAAPAVEAVPGAPTVDRVLGSDDTIESSSAEPM